MSAVRAGVLALALAGPAAASHAAEAVVVQPRAYGHVIGDVLTQRVLMQAGGEPFTPAALPAAERVNVWLERRPSRVETDADGRRWLVVDYQLVGAPRALAQWTLPAWQLRAQDGGGAALEVAAWPISVSPITPPEAFGQGDLLALRPDKPAPTIATVPIERALSAWAAALALTLGAWLAWLLWRNRRAARAQPFARALRELKPLNDDADAAWLAVHRAFDRTAGRTLQAGTLDVLFRAAPHFAPLRARVERFYAQSQQRFFGAGAHGETPALRALCAALRRLERRHER